MPDSIDPQKKTLHIQLVGYLFGKGGIQTHTHWLATGLSERGHSVQVVSPSPPGTNDDTLPAIRNYDLQVYHSSKKPAALWASLSKFRSRPFDVSVVCGTGWNAMVGALSNRMTKRRVFFEVMSGERNGFFDPRILVKCGFDAIVAQARSVETRFKREFGWSGLSSTIPALPMPLERSGKIAPPKPERYSNRRLKAAFFGRMAKHKKAAWLCERWNQISQYVECLDFHGSGPDEARIRDFLARNPENREIRLRGEYPGGLRYVALLQQYDVVLLPSAGQEGAPLVLLEAMACGVPFVANGGGGVPDYANPDCQITNGNLDEFVPSLKSIHDHIQSGQFSATRLQKHYADYFSFTALVDRWEGFLCRPIDAQ
jgi:glycosyltransferase involved in cell wall biosynthesis